MKIKLFHKLLLALFACTALVLITITQVTRVSIQSGFVNFLHQQDIARVEQLVPALAGIYAESGSWRALQQDPRRFYELVFGVLQTGVEQGFADRPRGGRLAGRLAEGRRGQGPRFQGAPGGPPNMGNAIHQRLFLLDVQQQTVVGKSPPDYDANNLLAIETDDGVVGWLGVAMPMGFGLPAEQAFIQHQRSTLLIGLGIGLAVAALLAWLLARHLSRPVEAVAGGIRALASGKFHTRLETSGSDEIATLGHDVNRLSSALAEHEKARKRWMSDMAHELRTPLAIISGELEAMNDGVRPLDKQQLASVRDEVNNLAALIDDLHSLAMTDSGALAYKMETLDMRDLLQICVETYAGRAADKSLGLVLDIPEKAVKVSGDEQRLLQLMRNLLDNSVCYTDEGGRIAIKLRAGAKLAVITISDTAPGVTGKEAGRLFERLYRLEASRNRNSGGSGLGLAIARNITEAHGGGITAEPGPDGGLLVTVEIPLQA